MHDRYPARNPYLLQTEHLLTAFGLKKAFSHSPPAIRLLKQQFHILTFSPKCFLDQRTLFHIRNAAASFISRCFPCLKVINAYRAASEGPLREYSGASAPHHCDFAKILSAGKGYANTRDSSRLSHLSDLSFRGKCPGHLLTGIYHFRCSPPSVQTSCPVTDGASMK